MVLMGWSTVLQIIDLATLTGACVVALGPSIAGNYKLKFYYIKCESVLFFKTIYQYLLVINTKGPYILVGTKSICISSGRGWTWKVYLLKCFWVLITIANYCFWRCVYTQWWPSKGSFWSFWCEWGETMAAAIRGKLLGNNEIRSCWHVEHWWSTRWCYCCCSLPETGMHLIMI